MRAPWVSGPQYLATIRNNLFRLARVPLPDLVLDAHVVA